MTQRKAKYKTIITQIVVDGYKKPQSPMFQIVNDGTVDMWIDGLLKRPGDSFGISVDGFVAKYLLKGIPVVNNTQYQIKFAAPGPTDRVSAQLIEVFIKLEQ